MQIQLKQVEIIAALKAYVTNKGISLSGKTFDISFTSGRKDNGLSADISIEDAGIPGTEVGDEVAAAVVTGTPVLAIVKPIVGAVAAIATPESEKALAAQASAKSFDEAVAPIAAEKAPVSSLFGS